ncbi:winged helix-turn-helix transcriptional regulator [Methanocella arvoryzae]|uniref:HTH arsR-type domain-containing protein n=1 Tax=Methanocella arvoryzae (strain DSM 22066 / NBRC 105507 / MRE50) TaxID=351160 RepID=Q0W8V3_METAR|nr:winged helix-turn-helix transcriptional regulator [Methanocella arvoryzae]CAJ35190.1 hypothetical protein LRC187 [Methanocella arvoryzae MRE50]
MLRRGLSLLGVGTLTILDRGGNRNRIMKLIEDQPGLTLSDIKRSLNMNIGTVRYHLFILSLHHCISSFNDGTKYVRYFKNSDTYSYAEMMIISMLRRSHVKEILNMVMAQPGIQSVEIAASLGVQEGVVSRCMRMLAVRGIVVKTSAKGEKAAYKIADAYKQLILSNI